MKKTILTLSLCALMLLGTACNKASNAPESVSIYQKLELSPEQKQELASIRKAQREEKRLERASRNQPKCNGSTWKRSNCGDGIYGKDLYSSSV